MIKVIRSQLHVKLETKNGASYSFPVELIRGMKTGDIEDRYYQAYDFLVSEQPNLEINELDIKQLFEDNI